LSNIAWMKSVFQSFLLLMGLIIFLLACKNTRYINNYNADLQWQQLRYSEQKPVIQGDTAFIIVSNRPIQNEKLRFALEEIDTTQLHYFYIAKQDSTWNVQEVNSLEDAISFMPSKNWVIYTEGMGKLFTGNIERAYLMTKMYDVNVILFDYASIHSDYSMFKNFNFSMNNSIQSAHQYTQFLTQVKSLHKANQFQQKSLSLFFHSMGNLMLREMIVHENILAINSTPFVDQLILNAACVPRKKHAQWIEKIKFAKHIYININKQDYKLRGAQLLSGNKKLGTRPISPLAQNVDYIDFNFAVGKTHNYFLTIPGRPDPITPVIKSYYNTVLNGKSVDLKSTDLFILNSSKKKTVLKK
jgi:hypothetical protein